MAAAAPIVIPTAVDSKKVATPTVTVAQVLPSPTSPQAADNDHKATTASVTEAKFQIISVKKPDGTIVKVKKPIAQTSNQKLEATAAYAAPNKAALAKPAATVPPTNISYELVHVTKPDGTIVLVKKPVNRAAAPIPKTAGKAQNYDPAVLHPVFFTEKMIANCVDVHPAAIGHTVASPKPVAAIKAPQTVAKLANPSTDAAKASTPPLGSKIKDETLTKKEETAAPLQMPNDTPEKLKDNSTKAKDVAEKPQVPSTSGTKLPTPPASQPAASAKTHDYTGFKEVATGFGAGIATAFVAEYLKDGTKASPSKPAPEKAAALPASTPAPAQPPAPVQAVVAPAPMTAPASNLQQPSLQNQVPGTAAQSRPAVPASQAATQAIQPPVQEPPAQTTAGPAVAQPVQVANPTPVARLTQPARRAQTAPAKATVAAMPTAGPQETGREPAQAAAPPARMTKTEAALATATAVTGTAGVFAAPEVQAVPATMTKAMSRAATTTASNAGASQVQTQIPATTEKSANATNGNSNPSGNLNDTTHQASVENGNDNDNNANYHDRGIDKSSDMYHGSNDTYAENYDADGTNGQDYADWDPSMEEHVIEDGGFEQDYEGLEEEYTEWNPSMEEDAVEDWEPGMEEINHEAAGKEGETDDWDPSMEGHEVGETEENEALEEWEPGMEGEAVDENVPGEDGTEEENVEGLELNMESEVVEEQDAVDVEHDPVGQQDGIEPEEQIEDWDPSMEGEVMEEDDAEEPIEDWDPSMEGEVIEEDEQELGVSGEDHLESAGLEMSEEQEAADDVEIDEDPEDLDDNDLDMDDGLDDGQEI
ncbi:hypothetical protein BP6252_12212 [Coleophoma cylindrospora]|uniref:Uncharacterized protein n=1 Tax=Coleophoma cylindrospora TaxID=1849047 RepID=A0A3D8QGC5_9HELO|nr:hypothetical protein BP6252_12212 [Coleophoma cylindrospora]